MAYQIASTTFRTGGQVWDPDGNGGCIPPFRPLPRPRIPVVVN